MRKADRLALCLALCSGVVSLVRTGPAYAQSAVHAVRFSADLATDDGSVIVDVEIDLVPDDTAGLRIELLGFGRGSTDGFMAGGPDGPLVRFEERSGSRQWIVVDRADFESVGLEPVAGTEVWRLRATYVVRNAGTTKGESVLIHVPVLTVALAPVRDAGDVFHAAIRAPTIWSVTEAFPSGLSEEDDGRYAVDLAVAPSVVSVRARTDGAWRPGVPLLLDILAGAILLAFVVLGLRWLRVSGGVTDSASVSSRGPAKVDARSGPGPGGR